MCLCWATSSHRIERTPSLIQCLVLRSFTVRMCERQRGSLKYKHKAASVCFSSRSSIGATSGETCEILSTRFWGTDGGAPDGRAVNALVEFFPASFWRSTKVVIMWSIWEAFAQHSQFLCQVPSLMLIRSGRVGSGRASVAPGTPQQFTLNQQINYNSARLHEFVCPITTTVTQNVTSVLTGRHIGHSVGGGASFSPMKAAQCCMKTGRPPPVLQLRAWALETSCLAPGSSRLSKCHWTECLQLWQ